MNTTLAFAMVENNMPKKSNPSVSITPTTKQDMAKRSDAIRDCMEVVDDFMKNNPNPVMYGGVIRSAIASAYEMGFMQGSVAFARQIQEAANERRLHEATTENP